MVWFPMEWLLTIALIRLVVGSYAYYVPQLHSRSWGQQVVAPGSSSRSSSAQDIGPDYFHHPADTSPKQTLYETIASREETTKFAGYIRQDKELLDILNSTDGAYTVFAPSDQQLAHISNTQAFASSWVRYHISPSLYPLENLASSATVATLLNSTSLCKDGCPARLRVTRGFNGVKINSCPLLENDIIAVNGVVHIIGGLLPLPPPVFQLLDSHPTLFSTFNLALDRSHLHNDLKRADKSVLGGTFFVPRNEAWLELDPNVAAFLFSVDGSIYLRALLSYHIAPYWTLFSNGIYPLVGGDDEEVISRPSYPRLQSELPILPSPDPRIQIDLPTLLDNQTLTIDLARLGDQSEIRINTYDTVSNPDLFASNAVVHLLDRILFPPNKLNLPPHELRSTELPLTVDELKERLAE